MTDTEWVACQNILVLQRDYLYIFFTLIVLAVLLYSLFSGYFS